MLIRRGDQVEGGLIACLRYRVKLNEVVMRGWMVWSWLATIILFTGCDKQTGSIALSSIEATPATKQQVATTPVMAKPQPKAVTATTTHNFGTMEFRSQGEHEFKVVNGGSEPLTLAVQETSCKCTAGSVSSEPILPGQSGLVRMEWNSGSKVEPFRQFAIVKTNDPQRAEISFVIEGTVRDEYLCDPPALQLGEIMPDAAATPAEIVIVSQRNEAFSIREVIAPTEFTATFVALTSEELAPRNAVKGYRIVVTPVGQLQVGSINSLLYVKIRADQGEDSERLLEVPIEGHMAGRLSVTGSGLRSIGEGTEALRWLEFGTRSYGQGAKAKLTLKVRDELKDLVVSKIEVEPSFLQVKLTPRPNASGLYDLLVEVPRDAPACGHRGDAMGSIRLVFDHPRVKQFSMLVDFSIRPAEELR